MKNLINIWNPNSGNQIVTLDDLKSLINDRRKYALNPPAKEEFQKEVTVHSFDKSLHQVAAHYKSFEISQMNIEKAIEVFNAGGGQIATIMKEDENEFKISELKKELNITNKDIAEFFNLTEASYLNSSAKKRYEDALCKFYNLIKYRKHL